MTRHTRYVSLLIALSALSLGRTAPALAGTVTLGTSGWKATWAASLDPYVNILVDSESPDAVFIEKHAEFIQDPGFGNIFPPIPITFMQTQVNAVPRIVIVEETITNSTGTRWTDFHMQLMEGDDAVFNVADTDASAGGMGFDTSPFSIQNFGADGTTLDLRGGVVPIGGVWNPGGGPNGGDLIIDVAVGSGTTADPLTVFTLKERPSIPEPTAVVMAGIAALLGVLPRARKSQYKSQ